MAYKSLPTITVANKAECFCRIRDFLCKRNGTYDYSTDGIGFVLWDFSYAVDEDNPQLNDWFVIYSPGESGDEELFFQFIWLSNYLNVYGFLSWNPSTHAGSTSFRYNTQNNWNIQEEFTNFNISAYGDMDAVTVMNYLTDQWRAVPFGKTTPVDTNISDTIVICSTSLSAGSDISITVDAVPTSWEVGSEIVIFTTHTDNISTVKAEIATIKTMVGSTITANLSNSYTADCKLTHHLGYFCSGNDQAGATTYNLISSGGTFNAAGGVITPAGYSSGYIDPTDFEDRHVLFPLHNVLTTYGAPIGVINNIKMFISFYAGLTTEDSVETFDGTIYKLRKCYSAKAICFKEPT